MTDLLDAVPMVEQGIPDASVIPLDQSACLLGKSPEASVPDRGPEKQERYLRKRRSSSEPQPHPA